MTTAAAAPTAQEPQPIASVYAALINAVLMVYGDTGTGKTTLLGSLAEYLWETHKKVFRLYTMDLGGFPSKVQVLMRLGIMQVWRMRNHVEPFETLELASLGYWPEQMDYRTGVAHPQARLVAPVSTEYTIRCNQGHVVLQTHLKHQIAAQMICPTCGFVTNPANWKLDTKSSPNPAFQRIGGVGFDSITAWNDELMADMAQRGARGDLGGAGSALGKGEAGKIISGDMVFGGNNQSHYGQAQNRSQRWLGNSTTIPGLLVPPAWTALEERATDDSTRLTIFGPQIAGKAKTADVPAWVGNCLRTCVRKNERMQDEWRLYLRIHSFSDEGNIPHLAKHRTDPDRLPEYFCDPPEASQDPRLRYTGFSLANFLRLLVNALESATEEAVHKYADAPALTGDMPLSVEVRPEAAANYALSQMQNTQAVTQPIAGTGVPVQTAASMAVAAAKAAAAPPVQPDVPPAGSKPAAVPLTPSGPQDAKPVASAGGAPLSAAEYMKRQQAAAATTTTGQLPLPKAPSSPRPPVARGTKSTPGS